jgi:hypothetical protein
MKEIIITEEQAKQMYDSGVESLKSIAEINFPELFNTDKQWEDFGLVEGYYIASDTNIHKLTYPQESCKVNKNTYPSEKEAERELSLIQLRQWRDKANGEHLESWCDWSDKNQTKYSICAYENSWKKHESILFREILVFKTKEIREQFIKDHKSLINKTFNL